MYRRRNCCLLQDTFPITNPYNSSTPDLLITERPASTACLCLSCPYASSSVPTRIHVRLRHCFPVQLPDKAGHCKIIGPTLGFLAMIVIAIVAWPAALFVCCCNREQANKVSFYGPIIVFITTDGNSCGRLPWKAMEQSVMRYLSDTGHAPEDPE